MCRAFIVASVLFFASFAQGQVVFMPAPLAEECACAVGMRFSLGRVVF